jgi:hypothetical protein
MLGFGIKNASHRLAGESKVGLAAFVLPVVILLVVYAVNIGNEDYNPWAIAFVWTAVVMTLSGLAALLIAGAKSLVS